MNIKNLVLKNPMHRTNKENEFLILYMKHQFEVFYDIDKPCIEMFVQRLSFDVYKPGDIVGKAGTPCSKLTMFIDGEVEAVTTLPKMGEQLKVGPRDGYIRAFTQGQSIGEECFSTENYKL